MPSLETGDVRLRYRLEGRENAPYLILSHALGASLDMWAPQMPSLLEHFRVLRYDARGHGQSSVPSGPYNIEQLCGDVIALMEHLAIKRAHFCGLSMGGVTGIWIAANYPARVDRLVLCSTAARIGTLESWNARIEIVNKEGIAAIVPTILDRWLTRDFQASVERKVDLVRRMLLQTPVAGYTACCAALRDADLRDVLSAIVAPTLVIAAMRDKATTPQECKLISERIRGALYTELKASHLSNWEVPQTFAAKVINFLNA